MSLNEAYNIVAGILLIVRAGFIAALGWSRWTRNLVLVRKGIKTTGLYQGDNNVSFVLKEEGRITFSTWRFIALRYNIGDKVTVLYHPANPYQAEVMSTSALWNQPFSNLTLAAAQILTAIFLFLGMNIAIAIVLMFVEWLACYFLAKFALYYLYPASRLQTQIEQQEPSNVQKIKEPVIQPVPKVPSVVHHATKRETREQLLHDMLFGFDLSNEPSLHDEEH